MENRPFADVLRLICWNIVFYTIYNDNCISTYPLSLGISELVHLSRILLESKLYPSLQLSLWVLYIVHSFHYSFCFRSYDLKVKISPHRERQEIFSFLHKKRFTISCQIHTCTVLLQANLFIQHPLPRNLLFPSIWSLFTRHSAYKLLTFSHHCFRLSCIVHNAGRTRRNNRLAHINIIFVDRPNICTQVFSVFSRKKQCFNRANFWCIWMCRPGFSIRMIEENDLGERLEISYDSSFVEVQKGRHLVSHRFACDSCFLVKELWVIFPSLETVRATYTKQIIAVVIPRTKVLRETCSKGSWALGTRMCHRLCHLDVTCW